MAYTDPYTIIGYKPFYLQVGGTDDSAIDVREAFHLVSKSNPYPLLPTPKDPYKNEWKDENGDEEYTERMFYKSIEFEVGFIIKAKATSDKTAEAVLRDYVGDFFEHIKEGTFRTYDAYTGIGFRDVRYVGYKEDSFKARGDWARAQFTITFKTNDPTTKIVMNGGSIVTDKNFVVTSGADSSEKVLSDPFIPVYNQLISVMFEYGNESEEMYFKLTNGQQMEVVGAPQSIPPMEYHRFQLRNGKWHYLGLL